MLRGRRRCRLRRRTSPSSDASSSETQPLRDCEIERRTTEAVHLVRLASDLLLLDCSVSVEGYQTKPLAVLLDCHVSGSGSTVAHRQKSRRPLCCNRQHRSVQSDVPLGHAEQADRLVTARAAKMSGVASPIERTAAAWRTLTTSAHRHLRGRTLVGRCPDHLSASEQSRTHCLQTLQVSSTCC